MELDGAAQIEVTATQLGGRQKLNIQATEQASLLTIALPHGYLVSSAVISYIMRFSDSFVS
jgi:hypothetical protein